MGEEQVRRGYQKVIFGHVKLKMYVCYPGGHVFVGSCKECNSQKKSELITYLYADLYITCLYTMYLYILQYKYILCNIYGCFCIVDLYI